MRKEFVLSATENLGGNSRSRFLSNNNCPVVPHNNFVRKSSIRVSPKMRLTPR